MAHNAKVWGVLMTYTDHYEPFIIIRRLQLKCFQLKEKGMQFCTFAPMKKLLLLILFVLNLVLLQAQEVKFISVNKADTTLENITFKRLPKLLEKDSLTADTLLQPARWMLKLQKKLTKKQRQDSNIYIFFCPSESDSVKAFLPLSGKYAYVLFDSSKTGVVELQALQKRLCTWKYQWDLIHDPQTMLFSFLQDESEGAMESTDDFQKLLQMLTYSGVNTFVFGVKCESRIPDSYSLYLNGYRYYFLKYNKIENEESLEITLIDNSEFPTEELYSKIKVPEFVIPATADKLLILNKEIDGVITPFMCNVFEDYPDACTVEKLTDIVGFYEKIGKDISNCILQENVINQGGLTIAAINDLLQGLQSEARSNQQFEFTQNGLVYRLNEQGQAEVIEDPLSDAEINAGNWTDGGVDMKMRIGFNADGILQLAALGIRKNLQLAKVNGEQKTATLTDISANMLAKNNALLKEHQVKDINTTLNDVGANLDSDAFPDGKKVAIDKEATFMKILCEAGGVGLSFLKTAEIEQPVYLETNANTIKAPPIATGTIESVGMVVTDITSAVVMVHDIVTDKEARTQAKDGFVEIGKQIKNEPQSLFPILLDVVLEEFTGATTDNYKEMTNDATDKGRKHHLTTKTAVRTTTSIFTSGKIITQLPDMSLEVATKMTKAKFFRKFDGLGDIADDVLEQFKDRLKNLPDGGEKLLDDFKDLADAESLRKLVDNPDFIDNWKMLDDANVDESIRKSIDAVSDPDAVADAVEAVGKAKPTWPEIQALWKRGNDFNKKALSKYTYNEIVLEGIGGKAGKRLDSYIPGKEIISRKATTLSKIQPNTFKGYLNELITKYPVESVLNSRKLPKGTKLSGDYFLEIPLSNKTFFESSEIFQKVLDDFNKLNKVDVKIKYLAE